MRERILVDPELIERFKLNSEYRRTVDVKDWPTGRFFCAFGIVEIDNKRWLVAKRQPTDLWTVVP